MLISSWDHDVHHYRIDTSNICTSGTEAVHKVQVFTHEAPVLDVCFITPDLAASGGVDRRLRLLDLKSGKTMILGKHEDSVSKLRWCPLTRMLISGSADRSICFWEVSESEQGGAKLLKKLDMPDKVIAMDVSPPFAQTTDSNDKIYSASLPGQPHARDSTPRLVVAMAGRHVFVYDLIPLRKAIDSEQAGKLVKERDWQPDQQRESSLKFMARDLRCMPAGDGYAMSSIEGRIAVEFFDPSEKVQAMKYAFKCHRETVKEGDEDAAIDEDQERLEKPYDVVYPVHGLAFHPRCLLSPLALISASLSLNRVAAPEVKIHLPPLLVPCSLYTDTAHSPASEATRSSASGMQQPKNASDSMQSCHPRLQQVPLTLPERCYCSQQAVTRWITRSKPMRRTRCNWCSSAMLGTSANLDSSLPAAAVRSEECESRKTLATNVKIVQVAFLSVLSAFFLRRRNGDKRGARDDGSRSARLSDVGGMSLGSALQTVGKHVQQERLVFQTDGNPNETSLDAKLCCPVELAVVRQDGVWTGEGEVGTQTGTLCALQCVVECLTSSFAVKRDGEKTSISSTALLLVVCFSAAVGRHVSQSAKRFLATTHIVILPGLVSRIKKILDHPRPSTLTLSFAPQHARDRSCVAVDLDDSAYEIARIPLHEDGILVKVCVFVMRVQRLLQHGVMLTLWIQHHASTHDIGIA